MAWQKQQKITRQQKLEGNLMRLRQEWKRLKAELAIYRRDREEHGWGKTDFEKVRERWILARLKAVEKLAQEVKSELIALGWEEEAEKPLDQRLDEETKRILAEEKSKGLLE